MSGCLDKCECPDWEIWETLRERRNAIASVVAGAMFSIGWWFIIDASIQFPQEESMHHATHVVGVVSTLALFLINAVSNGAIRGENYVEGCIGQTGARIVFFVGLCMGFSALIAATWILFGLYVTTDQVSKLPGIAIFLQNALIFFGGLVFKFGRSEEQY